MPSDSRVVTLITDFGANESYVAAIKGVILSINPKVQIIDISHSVSSYDIKEGAFILSCVYKYFPAETIHIAIVDPGVGGYRRALAVKTRNFYFLGPDNGILSYAIKKEKVQKIIALANNKYFMKEISSTFHGRDIFAPVAAHISNGMDIKKMGKEINKINEIAFPEINIKKSGKVTLIQGKIIYKDSFGNLVSNISKEELLKITKNKTVQVFIGKHLIGNIKRSYYEAEKGEALAVWGSYNYLEISVREGSAFKRFGKPNILVKTN